MSMNNTEIKRDATKSIELLGFEDIEITKGYIYNYHEVKQNDTYMNKALPQGFEPVAPRSVFAP